MHWKDWVPKDMHPSFTWNKNLECHIQIKQEARHAYLNSNRKIRAAEINYKMKIIIYKKWNKNSYKREMFNHMTENRCKDQGAFKLNFIEAERKCDTNLLERSCYGSNFISKFSKNCQKIFSRPNWKNVSKIWKGEFTFNCF